MDDGIDPAQPRFRFGEQGLDFDQAAHVGFDRDGPPAGGLNLRNQRAGVRGAAGVLSHNVETIAGQASAPPHCQWRPLLL